MTVTCTNTHLTDALLPLHTHYRVIFDIAMLHLGHRTVSFLTAGVQSPSSNPQGDVVVRMTTAHGAGQGRRVVMTMMEMETEMEGQPTPAT